MLSNLLLLSSEPKIQYTQNTCNRTYSGKRLLTDAERKSETECACDRNEQHKKQGIGKKLTKQAINDMRTNYGCKEIDLISPSSAEKFWEKIGAKPGPAFTHVFPNPSNKR